MQVFAQNKIMGIVINIDEIDFTVVAVPKEYYVDFTVYEICARSMDEHGNYTVPEWPVKGHTNSLDTSNSLERSDVYMSGMIKWDGCSNWDMVETKNCMLHFCSRDDLQRISAVMIFCWDLMRILCPKWSPF